MLIKSDKDTQLLDLITSPQAILRVLRESKDHQTIVGINAKRLGEGTFLTGVSDILQTEELSASPTIVLKSYDVTGHFLNTNILKLDDITSVLPFSSRFENPFMKNLEHR